ncbi:unnamed protein product [Ixodes persulcatus]
MKSLRRDFCTLPCSLGFNIPQACADLLYERRLQFMPPNDCSKICPTLIREILSKKKEINETKRCLFTSINAVHLYISAGKTRIDASQSQQSPKGARQIKKHENGFSASPAVRRRLYE